MNAPIVLVPDRRLFLGGTDAAAVLGLSPYLTPFELWQQKTGRKPSDTDDPKRQRYLQRGKKLEPFIVDMVLDKLRERGHEVKLVATNERYTDPEHDFLSCEVDFELELDGEHINGDAKSVTGFMRKRWGEEDSEDVPTHMAAQFMHGLMATGRERCVVAALIGLDDVGIYWVNRDDETIAAMRRREVSFWRDHVLADVPPPPLKVDDVLALYPQDNGEAIEASDRVAELVREFAELKKRIAELQKVEDDLKLAITEYIAPHSRLVYGGRDIATWKTQQTRRLNQRLLAERHPDVLQACTVNDSMRVLRTTKAALQS